MADKSKIEWTDASWNPIRARVRVGKQRAGRVLDGKTHSEFPTARE